MKPKTYAHCKSRTSILKQLACHETLMLDPEDGKIKWLFCAYCGFMAISPATARILKAAKWIERVGEVKRADGGNFWEVWGISNAGREVIGQ